MFKRIFLGIFLTYHFSLAAKEINIDDFVNKAMHIMEVPGVAIAIVKDDKVVLAKGYGVKTLGEDLQVDANTSFAIGSVTKSFTAATIALLVDEGKLNWDDPISKYLQDFQLFDQYVTSELTIRDVLSHRCGLPRADLLWYSSPFSRSEILYKLRFVPLCSSFRSSFGYQNIMFLAAGEVVSAVTVLSWNDFVKEKLFIPLGMYFTNTSIINFSSKDNVASPHIKMENKVMPIHWQNMDNLSSGGGINSTAYDMAQWIRLHLGKGEYENKRLLNERLLKEMHTSQTIIRFNEYLSSLYPKSNFLTYGLGWFLFDFKGKKVIEHSGKVEGMSSLVAMIPEDNLGVVILTNMHETLLPFAVMYHVFEEYLGSSDHDWIRELLKVSRNLESVDLEKIKQIEKDRASETSPLLPIESYVGIYRNEIYGDAEVFQESNRLILRFLGREGKLEHWYFDTFKFDLKNPYFPFCFLTFNVDISQNINSVHIATPSAELDVDFDRN